jgi:hypothetical protein
MYSLVQSLISPELRSVVKHASLLAKGGKCTNPSSSFTTYAFNELTAANLLPSNVTLPNFTVCDYLSELQQALNFTSELNDDVSYTNFVIVPENLNNTLHQYFADITFDAEFVSILLSVLFCPLRND